jgi:hypothetical protein
MPIRIRNNALERIYKNLTKDSGRYKRSYHIFYFMITHTVDLHEYLSDNIYDYPLMSMGKVRKSFNCCKNF